MSWWHDVVGAGRSDLGWQAMSVRAAIIFIYGLAIVRIAGWRAFGKWSAPDIIIAIIVGSNLSRALTGTAPLVPALVASTLLVLLYLIVTYAAARWNGLDWLAKGRAVQLIRDGKLDDRAMRRWGVSPRDLDEAIRHQGVRDLCEIRAAYLERDGRISVIRSAAEDAAWKN